MYYLSTVKVKTKIGTNCLINYFFFKKLQLAEHGDRPLLNLELHLSNTLIFNK